MGDTIDVRSKPSNVEAINRHISVLSKKDLHRFYDFSENRIMEHLTNNGYKDIDPFNYDNVEDYKIAIDNILKTLHGLKKLLPSNNDYKLSKKDFTNINVSQLRFSHDPEECIEEIDIVDKILLDAFGRPDKISLDLILDYLDADEETRQKNRLRFHDVIDFVYSEYYKNPHASIIKYFQDYHDKVHAPDTSLSQFLRLDHEYREKYKNSEHELEKFISKFNGQIFVYYLRIMVIEGLSECFAKTLSMFYEEDFKPLNDLEKENWKFPEFNVITYKFFYCTPGFKEEWRHVKLPALKQTASTNEENNENDDNNNNFKRIGNNRVNKPKINIAKRKFLERQERRRQRAINN
ncbi:uncharacterized protein KGF55_005602 [Candida pseudojiufengensis]|uniref:uncharacterized protein n=1 Tax=Candida pseudojiufengensis TaxID=497109 RepID=UPI002225809D|nr:uncharacterized protein KGF55_005602 [Candida pseudojiufengensis]KAI5958948.1 hypothetical protein KGF55_005602 [Candida pseudojiufengensis]